MPTGAVDGHVLTSDRDGNGTWQAPGGQAKTSCAGVLTAATSGTGTFTINFPFTFNSTPDVSASAIVVSGANAGKTCLVTNLIATTTYAQMDLQYHDGAAWTDVGGAIQVQVAYTAIAP